MNEEWKPIPGFKGYYEVSSIGRVRSLDRTIVTSDCRSWIQPGVMLTIGTHHKGGYSTVSLCKNNKPRIWLVHRLVAMAFIPNPLNLPEVNHCDGKKRNNRFRNLEWALRKDNIDHAVANKLIDNKGEKNPQAKITADQARAVRELRAQGYARAAIALMTGVTVGNIGNILQRKSWNHI